MADKIPVYGELDCRTAENIIADAEQIRYDTTKNVKEKIEELVTGGGDGNDSLIIRQLCAIADRSITYPKVIKVKGHGGPFALYVNGKNSSIDVNSAAVGTANKNGTFTSIDLTNSYKILTGQTESMIQHLSLPFSVVMYVSNNKCTWSILEAEVDTSKVTRITTIQARTNDIDTLPISLGVAVTGTNWIKRIDDEYGIYYKATDPYEHSFITPAIKLVEVSGFNSTPDIIDAIEILDVHKGTYTLYVHMTPTNKSTVSGSFELRLLNYLSVDFTIGSCFVFGNYNNPDGELPQSNYRPIEFTYNKYPPVEQNNGKILQVTFKSSSNWNNSDGVDIQLVFGYTINEK